MKDKLLQVVSGVSLTPDFARVYVANSLWCILERGEKLSLGSGRAQVALTSEERPNGRANTVITKASLQGAACSESAAPEQACVLMYMRVYTFVFMSSSVLGLGWNDTFIMSRNVNEEKWCHPPSLFLMWHINITEMFHPNCVSEPQSLMNKHM